MSKEPIYMREKENPPREKKAFSTLTIRVTCDNPKVIISDQVKEGASLKIGKPLVEKVEGPFNEEDELVEEMTVGMTYVFKATEFKESMFTLIKHIWWAEQLDDGKINDLEYKKGENPYLDEKGVVCFKYNPQESVKVRIYSDVAKTKEKVSVECKVISKKVVAFFIGGAADKESYYGQPATKIVDEQVKENFIDIISSNKLTDFYEDIYLGYNEVRGEEDIDNHVLSKITDKDNTAVYIIGHSLGGWNGAHLSQILTDMGYNVDLLITLDPVGKQKDVTLISDIYWTTPKPKTNYWINISTYPENEQMDDIIADIGGQWKPKVGPQINDRCVCHHGSAGFMFDKPLKDTNISASDMLLHQIKLYLSK